jgi:hypothetical protein
MFLVIATIDDGHSSGTSVFAFSDARSTFAVGLGSGSVSGRLSGGRMQVETVTDGSLCHASPRHRC